MRLETRNWDFENGRVDVKLDWRPMRRAIKAKAPLRVQFLLTFGGRGEEQEALDLLSKKKGVGRGL